MSGRGYYAQVRGGRGGPPRRDNRGEGRGFRKRPPTENYHQAPVQVYCTEIYEFLYDVVHLHFSE